MLGRVKAIDYEESDEDGQVVSELMDDIRDTVTDYQVSDYSNYLLPASSSRRIGLDGAPTSHIRSELRTDCE